MLSCSNLTAGSHLKNGMCVCERWATASSEPNSKLRGMSSDLKNQQDDVREWIEHHHKLGASKFYVMDNNSTVPMVNQLYDFIDAGVVIYKYFVEYEHPSGYAQSWAYDQCLQRYGSSHRWMAFIDADEFLMLKQGYQQLPDLLREYEMHAALAVNWLVFSSSGHIRKPQGSTLQNYQHCFPTDNGVNRHVKIIANTQYTVEAGGTPHEFVYSEGKHAVDAAFNKVDSPFTKTVQADKVVLHHYVLKSLQEFESKMLRGAAHGTLVKDLNFFWMIDTQATELCLQAAGSMQVL
ncbi:hypothetical protein WJX72_002009 [[Myrmecia] bisecta]|uniref:Glycosyltransferase family 92 protein n=1 Tax=[Myrmecia] bisecta TaxID=41462 RepID=A0AAW1R5K0_9CHLO